MSKIMKTANVQKPNYSYCLLQQSCYIEKYKLLTESVLMMGEQNPPVKTLMQADVEYRQEEKDRGIVTTIDVSNLKGTSNNPALYNSLQELYVVSEINPRLVVKRNKDGKVSRIENINEMENEWQNWKENKLATFIPNIRKQKRFINNYERGMKRLRYCIEQNFQYMLLFPECYRFKEYATIENRSMGKIYNSRFIEDMHIPYRLVAKSFLETVDGLKMSMFSLVDDEVKLPLKSFYKKYLPEFSVEDYDFFINLEYLFEKETGKVINGKLSFCEMLHPNFQYKIEISMFL